MIPRCLSWQVCPLQRVVQRLLAALRISGYCYPLDDIPSHPLLVQIACSSRLVSPYYHLLWCLDTPRCALVGDRGESQGVFVKKVSRRER